MNDSIWHDASDEPDKSGSLVLFANGHIIFVREGTSDWAEIKSKYNFSIWAYYDSFVTQSKIEFIDTQLLSKEE